MAACASLFLALMDNLKGKELASGERLHAGAAVLPELRPGLVPVAAAADGGMQLHTDPHSLPRFRVNGIVQNMPEFQKAFACTAGKPMVAAPACRIW